MADLSNKRTIKYVNKDFSSFKRDLIQFTQAHQSGAFQDFNETSPGMAILELQAYIADVLSYYQDRMFDELKQDTARQAKNIVALARQRGYRPAGKRAAGGTVTLFVEVPAQSNMSDIDDSYSPTLRKGAKLQGPNGVVFESLDDVDFSSSPRSVTGSRFDQTTGLPTYYAIMKDVDVIAGETKVDQLSIDSFKQFRTVQLSNADVIEVLSVVDSEGNDYYEVDYLAQEAVFESMVNSDVDSDEVPYVLTLRTVPYRFIVDRDPTTGVSTLVFGSGDGASYDDQLVPNIADLALPLPGRSTFTSVSIDPQNFLKTSTLGIAPYNTTLTVTYRVGGGDITNVPAGSITSVIESTFDFSTTGLTPSKVSDVQSSIEVINRNKTEGGAQEETVAEINANSAAFFAAQNRVVTREDYIARIMSLPSKFGKPEKVTVVRNPSNGGAIDIRVLSIDSDGHLSKATSTLKNNIKKYISFYRGLTDDVNILDAEILNVGIDFEIVISPKMHRNDVLSECLNAIKDRMSVANMQIACPIIISELESILQSVNGVISVSNLFVKNLSGISGDGLTYSQSRIDMSSRTMKGIVHCPANSIFEVKYPNKDIRGRGV